jgi:CheY-like chemotaxis protein
MGTCTDIHDHKLATDKLKEADQRKDEFLAMLAHELRNPLAPISAAAALLKVGKLDSAGLGKASDIISRQVGHMISLVDDLLDVSRVTQGLVELRSVPLEIHGMLDQAVEQVSPLIASRNQQLRTRIGVEQCMITGDENRLVQIIGNLLTNASKYTPVGGNINLIAEVLGDSLVVKVEDDGIGMSSDLVGRVFDLFVQAERTPDRVSGGLGLGLALVKRLVELHGGTVGAESKGPGQGSRFTVSLARMGSSAQTNPNPLPIAAQLELTPQLKILVVDDNVDAALMLSMYLEMLGHHVFVEHGSAQAIARGRIERPDACLLDIGLPDMNGYELAKRLRAQPETKNSVLIAVTGYGQAQDIQNSLAAGFNHHMVKPVIPAELERLLRDTANSAVDSAVQSTSERSGTRLGLMPNESAGVLSV